MAMESTDWTTIEAYASQGDCFHAAVADAAARHMYRAFDRMVGSLDRAAARTRSPSARADIDAAVRAMTAAAATQDVLRRILLADEVIPFATALGNLCRAMRSDARADPSPTLELNGDAAFAWIEPSTAWTIGAALVEMVDEVGVEGQVRIRAQCVDGHLAVVVNRRRIRAAKGRFVVDEPCSLEEVVAGGGLLDRLAGLLFGRVVRSRHRGRPGVALVVRVRLSRSPSPDLP